MKSRTALLAIVFFIGTCRANGNMVLNGDFEVNTAPGNVFHTSNEHFNNTMNSVTAFGSPGIAIQTVGSNFGSSPQSGNWKVSLSTLVNGQSQAFSFALSDPLNSGLSYDLEFYFERLTDSGFDGGSVLIGVSETATSFGSQVFQTLPSSLGWTLASTTFVAPHNANFLTVKVDNAANHWVGLDNFTLDRALTTPTPTTQIVGTGDDYTLSISDTGRVAILDIDAAEYEDWANGNTNSAKVHAMSNRVFNHLQDSFDFVFFVSDEDSVRPGAVFGRHYRVKNDIEGLGKSVFDFSSFFGSNGELESAIHLTSKSGILGGPSLHEIAHRWANSLDSVPTGAHWGFAGVGGQLGGWEPGTLVDLGDNTYDADGPNGSTSFGTFANGGNSLDYAELELYLMGLIGPDEVSQDIVVPENPTFVDSGQGVFSATSLQTVSIGDIIAIDGARVPDANTSQKDFRAIVVVLTDDPLTNARVASYDSDIARFSQDGPDTSYLFNFWEATGGRATIQMDGLWATLKPLPGDFDDDRDVDGADFLKWQRDGGTSAGLALWGNNYGTNSSSASAAVESIPEPSSSTLAFLCLCVSYSCKRLSHV